MSTDSVLSGAAGPADVLLEFGFNAIEAAIYRVLRQNPGLTGYRIAKLIGKQQANTYQALASLLQKGAVLVEEAESRTYSAVPPRELIGRLRRSFAERCDRAETALAQISAPEVSDRVEYIKNADQVYERARSMLNAARETIVLEFWPQAMSTLLPELEAATGRGVAAAGLVLEPEPQARGVTLVCTPSAPRLIELCPGVQITLIVDGRQVLLATMEAVTGRVVNAVWSDNPYMALTLHNGIVSDILFHRDLAERIPSPNIELLGRLTTAFQELMSRSRGNPDLA